MLGTDWLKASAEVKAAIAEGRPVVALESTIIAHGFPFPDNFQLGQALEANVRAAGAVPATIAIIGGCACVGLTEAQLHALATESFTKAAARNIPAAVAKSANAATTVSATCLIAEQAGIEVFATGGIGGVHRGAGEIFDESADLAALARHKVLVVSAGAKAILDIPRTIERLETLGVPVAGFRCDEFPAFYTRRSGSFVADRLDSIEEIATAWRVRRSCGGMLLANPIPSTAEVAPQIVDSWVSEALQNARKQGIIGKSVTPFLLAEIARLSAGASVVANRALALHNARTAAQIAVALCSQANHGADKDVAE